MSIEFFIIQPVAINNTCKNMESSTYYIHVVPDHYYYLVTDLKTLFYGNNSICLRSCPKNDCRHTFFFTPSQEYLSLIRTNTL